MQVARSRVHVAKIVGTVLAAASLGLVWATPASAATAPDKSLSPFVSCYWDNGDNTVTVSIGVTSSNTETVEAPVGVKNKVTGVQGVKDDFGQPTSFLPGRRVNIWAPTVSSQDIAKGAEWNLTGNKLDLGSVTQCSAKPVPAEGNALAVLAFSVLVAGVGSWAISGRGRRPGASGVA